MNKKLFLLSAPVFGVQSAFGICPLCSVALGAGVGVTRWFGVHDVIIGIWIGGFLLALAWWLNMLVRRCQWTFIGYRILIPVLVYGTGLGSLWLTCGFGACRLWHSNCLLLGIVLWSVLFALGDVTSCVLKKSNDNRVFFKFQKVIIPCGLLVLASFLIYLILK